MTTSETTTGEPGYPPQKHEASELSQRNKREAQRSMLGRLTTLVLIAVLASVATAFEGTKQHCLVLSIFAFMVLAVFELRMMQRKPDKQWYDAREMTEAMKSLVWRYAAKDDTFPDEPDVDVKFAEKVKDLRENYKHLTLVPGASSGSPVTQWMAGTRKSDLATRKNSYLKYRLLDQIDWYGKKVRENEKLEKRWSRALIGVCFIGVGCALLEIMGTLAVDVLGVVGALSTSVLAWTQSQHFASLAHAYSITRSNLELLLPQFHNVNENNWPRLIDDVEDELAREHSAWQKQQRRPKVGY